MTNLDQFTSVFKSADKLRFHYGRVHIGKVLVVTDLSVSDSAALTASLRKFLSVLETESPAWETLSGEDFGSVNILLEKIEAHKPDLIVTYRHLHSDAWNWPHGLGEYLDVITQVTTTPVVVIPHPDAGHARSHSLTHTKRVMAITDHLAGDDSLVNHALRFVEKGGSCWLAHVEGGAQFDRYTETIGKIPSIETEMARETILEQLLKEPRDYINSCREALAAENVPTENVPTENVPTENLPVVIEEVVTLGHRLSEYRRLVEEHEIDLLVFYTKDQDQLAMHGLAYPLAVELRSIPILML
jgi:hypothetical protein